MTEPDPVLASDHAGASRAPLPRFALIADAVRSNEEIVAELAAVAEQHAPDGGYGETAWNAETGTVFWQHADWTSNDAHDAAEAAFRAIEGVREYECDAEGGLPYDYETGAPNDGWEIVWPEGMTAAAEEPIAVEPLVVDLPAAPTQAGRSPHALLASAGRALAEVAEALALEQQVPVQPQQLHVHVAQPAIHLQMATPAAPDIVVNVPEQPAPEVNVTVEAAPAPQVDVHVAPTPIQVDVAAPAVQVDVEVPRPGPIRVETEEDGTRVYIPEPA